MTDPELLARIDARLAEGNELMRENRRALEESRRAYEDQRQFMQATLVRLEKLIARSDKRWRATPERRDERWRATLDRYFGSGHGSGPEGATT